MSLSLPPRPRSPGQGEEVDEAKVRALEAELAKLREERRQLEAELGQLRERARSRLQR